MIWREMKRKLLQELPHKRHNKLQKINREGPERVAWGIIKGLLCTKVERDDNERKGEEEEEEEKEKIHEDGASVCV